MPLKVSTARELISDMIVRNLDNVIDREIAIPVDVPKIISILGPRRAGKTSVCLQIIKKLRDTLPPDRLLYINFEDDRFYPAQLEDMDTLIRSYYSMYPDNKKRKVYFFFDEVQEIPGWEKFVRRLLDQENCRIYLTGSSSKLLSREIASALRGRTLSYEIFPLSFSEFLTFNNISYDETSTGKSLLRNGLEKFFWQGGFPELTFIPQSLHLPTVSEYIDLMLYRDLTERFNLRNPQLMKYMLKYMLTNIANPMSISKVFNDLKSQGYSLSKNTAYEYLSYLEEAFALYRTSRWSTSVRKTTVNPIKIYCVDQSFKYAMNGKRDVGRIFENIVYMAIRRLGIEPYYALNKQEVDFFTEQPILINACDEIEDTATWTRELEALNEAMGIYNTKTSFIINMYDENEVKTSNGSVFIIPLDKFLLHPKNYVQVGI
ncbi:MAG: ATP-binding protein [Cyclobacteriaceae bacterium]|nr:ATP-binding protein [Cyclobacteriaceae bacterium HetDA_MAG_MS6]